MSARRKAEDGLSKVLYVRVSDEMHEQVEAARAEWSEHNGVEYSASDIVRMYIEQGLKRGRGKRR